MMGKQNVVDRLREWVGGVAFRVFLWAYRMTNEEYLEQVYDDARREYESERATAWLMQ